MGGLKCYSCRRLVLRRAHVIILILIAVAVVFGLLELAGYMTPNPLETF